MEERQKGKMANEADCLQVICRVSMRLKPCLEKGSPPPEGWIPEFTEFRKTGWSRNAQ